MCDLYNVICRLKKKCFLQSIFQLRATTVFIAVERFYEEKEIPMQNVLQCTTDGAVAMVGKHRGFIALMKRKIPVLIATHYFIHRQHLVARNLRAKLHHSLHIVIKCINKIKANSLNDRLFRPLCHDNKEDFEHLLLHTEVRWLSKGTFMTRFYFLYDLVIEFLSGIGFQLAEAVEPLKNNIAYLADIFTFMNEVNKKLPGEMITLIRCKNVLTSFISKLSLYKENMGETFYLNF